MPIYKLKKLLLNFKVLYKIFLSKPNYEQSICGIVFSKDRPLQLYALLESYFMYCKDPVPLFILYKFSDNDYKHGYVDVEELFKEQPVTFISETSFRDDLIAIMNKIKSKYIFFLVDDNIFKSYYSFSDYLSLPNHDNYILSLRLGKNLNYCYTKSVAQELPQFKAAGKFLSWEWKNGQHDWNYSFSVDGNVYTTIDVIEMTKMIRFKAPNTYESNMNVFRFLLRRRTGLCFHDSILVNVCLNRVQDEIDNISADIPVRELQKHWSDHKKIDITFFHNFDNKSAHIEVFNLPLVRRK